MECCLSSFSRAFPLFFFVIRFFVLTFFLLSQDFVDAPGPKSQKGNRRIPPLIVVDVSVLLRVPTEHVGESGGAIVEVTDVFIVVVDAELVLSIL